MVDGGGSSVRQVDEMYEFCAPRFFDFVNEESKEKVQRAEFWFESSLSYDPSPFTSKIREGRSVRIVSLCDFGNIDRVEKVGVLSRVSQNDSEPETKRIARSYQQKILTNMEVEAEQGQVIEYGKISFDFCPQVYEVKPCQTNTLAQQEIREEVPSFEFPVSHSVGVPVAALATFNAIGERSPKKILASSTMKNHASVQTCTARLERFPDRTATSRRIQNSIHQRSALKQKSKISPVQSSKSIKSKNHAKCPSEHTAKYSMSTRIAHENQAIKRQKLEDALSRQRVKSFLSAAEIINKFHSGTRELKPFQKGSLSHDSAASLLQRRPKLTLTRPKDPELETAHRVRAIRIKSYIELEEEMLAKIPKFRARPLNKKEFHLNTMERANQHAETSLAVSSDTSIQPKSLKLAEPRPPHLETSLRARPLKNKSSQELEMEELEKILKFKARPFNKKIIESKGDIDLLCNSKPQITIPEEFHFATNDRLGPPAAVVHLFGKLSLHSESSDHERTEILRITVPNPFHLHTEERGLKKERQFSEQLLQKELQEERARIPRANPYPYTTDYPVLPPKPESKQCTKPETFQLESLVRHEEEMQRMLEEGKRAEREEAQRRIFRAQPILKIDPLSVPEKERKPLTEVQEFALHVDLRAVQRTEFDKKIKEKELAYKRIREEQEFAKLKEEEKAVKQIRRTMVPHANPLPIFNNPFVPQKSLKEATKPKSPDLRVNHRVERRQQFHMR